MKSLLNGEAKKVLAGKYYLVVNSVLGTGTAAMTMAVGTRPFQAITGASFTGSNSVALDLPECMLKATITGDSAVDLYRRY